MLEELIDFSLKTKYDGVEATTLFVPESGLVYEWLLAAIHGEAVAGYLYFGFADYGWVWSGDE